MNVKKVDHWVFRNIKLHSGSPFGLRIPEFEKKTQEEPLGFCVNQSEFLRFLETSPQIIDGEIEAFSANNPAQRLFRLECFDASQWEIVTDSADFNEQLFK